MFGACGSGAIIIIMMFLNDTEVRLNWKQRDDPPLTHATLGITDSSQHVKSKSIRYETRLGGKKSCTPIEANP